MKILYLSNIPQIERKYFKKHPLETSVGKWGRNGKRRPGKEVEPSWSATVAWRRSQTALEPRRLGVGGPRCT